MKVLLVKLAAIVQSKVAVAVLGAIVMAGGGTAVAVAATHSQRMPLLGSWHSTTHTASRQHITDAGSGQGNTTPVSAEGMLTRYIAPIGTDDGAITVKEADGSTVAFSVNSGTRVNGAHANTLADLPGVVGNRVQVQGVKQTDSTPLATKITVQGGDKGDQTGPTELRGTVASVNVAGLSFTLTTDSGPVTIAVTADTKFAGKIGGLAELRSGDSVNVQGVKQPGGTIVATRIEGGN